MSSEIWTPLDRATQQIRLAYLAPSSRLEEQPSCTLHIVSLNDDPHYEALSYVWGDPNITLPIQLCCILQDSTTQDQEDGALSLSTENKAGSTRWPVTTDLEAALRYLRHEAMVPLMKNIYSNAATVRVWLGSPTAGSDDAITILKGMGQGVPLEEIKHQNGQVNDNDLRSVMELMARPWWHRTWVQQEQLLSKRTQLHCGTSSLEWSDMPSIRQIKYLWYEALKSSRFNKEVLSNFTDNFDDLTRIRSIARVQKRKPEPTDEDLVVIFAEGRLCDNSDERDSIYGFLGLMSENIASKIKPNYNMSVADVSQDTAIQLTPCSNSLILLSLTQYTASKERGTPTWVPS